MQKMPALFIGHGSPMNIIQDNDYTRALARLGSELPRPKAVLCVSAHWLTRHPHVDTSPLPRQIYDFSGFPQALYDVVYPAKGCPDLAKRVMEVTGGIFTGSPHWGMDHAAWAVLKHIYPDADIPLCMMSLDLSHPLKWHYDTARLLAPLRDEGVLVLASGNIVHNLMRMDFAHQDASPYGWAKAFDDAVADAVLRNDIDALVAWEGLADDAKKSVPSLDHYIPLLYTLGVRGERECVETVYEGFQHGSISMRSIRVG